MNTFEITRAVYRRLRTVPFLGTLVESVRYRRLPVISTAANRYASQQSLIEAHGHALSGLRQAVAHNEAYGHALAGLRQAVARLQDSAKSDALRLEIEAGRQALKDEFQASCHALEAELFKQVNELNLRFDSQQSSFDGKLEFQRQEMLFEFRYAANQQPRAAATTQPEAARVVNAQKLDQQRQQGAVRLNVGCGHKPDPDRINVDMRELPGVDIVATVDQLPFSPGEIQEIHSAHLLEHFPLEQLRRSLLPSWIALLRPGGELRAIVPDMGAMLQAYGQQELDFATLRLIIFGGQEYEGDFHQTMFTPETLAELFSELGLVDVRVEARARRNGLCLECAVVGNKP